MFGDNGGGLLRNLRNKKRSGRWITRSRGEYNTRGNEKKMEEKRENILSGYTTPPPQHNLTFVGIAKQP
jgi:hypothetical protein